METLDFRTQFTCSEDFLQKLVEASLHPAHLKGARTNQYVFDNRPHYAGIFGLAERSPIMGRTVREVMDFFKHEEAFVNTIEALDLKVQQTGQSVKTRLSSLTHSGLLGDFDTVKVPITGRKKNRTIAILTTAYNVTHEYNTFELLARYQQIYPDREAIQYFLRHLKIDHYFNHLPTPQETLTLLALRQNFSYEYAAQKLGISRHTIDAHADHLRLKLQNTTLRELLTQLRA